METETTTTAARFIVARQYGSATRRQLARFATYEDALAAAEATTPDTDGQLVPNVRESAPAGYAYERGVFWLGNRYAVIYQATA